MNELNYEEVWKAVLAEIELNVSKANFATWFQNTSLLDTRDGSAVVRVPNAFTKEWLENKYNKAILKILRNLSGDIKEVRYTIATEAPQRHSSTPSKPRKRPSSDQVVASEQQLELGGFEVDPETGLNPKYTFDSFIVGSFNELAHAAALAITKGLGNSDQSYNPLFIYGGVGLGKTHLLQAVGNDVVRNLGLKVKYVTSERFTNELISAISNQTTERFKEEYRKVDVLIIDDIQFLAGKERTQEEFFHTFNALYEKNKRIILSSDRPPKAIPTLEERLRSRFEGGMIADISEPDQETRLTILKSKCLSKQVVVPEEILNYISQTIQKNIRELEGALNRVIANWRLTGSLPNIETSKQLLNTIVNTPKKNLTAKQIIKCVADFYDVQEKDLIRKNRRQEVVKPRQIAMYLLRTELKSSFPFIGQRLGGRDHTTAIHACEKISQQIKTNSTLSDEIKLVVDKLYNE
ncbi:chromosomal replication initiator protein DnaA [Candidatus Parcubacteria bacterium]|nr:MAG: chromosomal replication initiator protein DnaA [Candidatus Parcubacteria bacterium]